jgi:hypothetical protein
VLKWMARVVRGVAVLFMVFCAILATGNAWSMTRFQPNTDTPGGAWAVYPESVERAVVWSVLTVVLGCSRSGDGFSAGPEPAESVAAEIVHHSLKLLFEQQRTPESGLSISTLRHIDRWS